MILRGFSKGIEPGDETLDGGSHGEGGVRDGHEAKSEE
jgi:hypothetical protein